ncbi:hypothetical protein ACR9E3_06260 [Actinomycetospora sp. C-140]
MTPDRASPARAVLLGGVAAVFGAAAHGEAGGVVALSPATAAVALAVAVTTALVGARPRSAPVLAAVLAGGQLALHLAMPAAPAMHDHHGHASGPGPGMLAAHLGVAVVVAVGLAQADRALLRTARRHAVAWTRQLTGPPPAPAPGRRVPRHRTTLGRPRRAAVGHHPRRGPPSPRRTGPHPVPAATTPRPGRTPLCPTPRPIRGPRPPAHARGACSPSC